jgi:hypothetical protein
VRYVSRALLPFLLRLLAKHHDHSVQKARRKRMWSSHDGEEAFSEEQEMEVSDKDEDGEETSSKRKREDSVRGDSPVLPAKRKRNDDSRLALDESGDAMEFLTDLYDDDAAEKDSFTIEEEGSGEEELNAMLPTAEGAYFDPLVRPFSSMTTVCNYVMVAAFSLACRRTRGACLTLWVALSNLPLQ